MSNSLVKYWQQCIGPDKNGRWVHPDDETAFTVGSNPFNVDYPPAPFVGDIINAPILILGLNGRYSAGTKLEFDHTDAANIHMRRIHEPTTADWRIIPAYYLNTNFGHFITSGKAALVNGCTYRSPKWTTKQKGMAASLPSCAVLHNWLRSEVVPTAIRGERLVIAWRWNSWGMKQGTFEGSHFLYQSAPASPYFTSETLKLMREFGSN